MSLVLARMSRYPFVLATVAAGAVGLALLAAGLPAASRWVVSLYALVIAGKHAWAMVQDLRHGRVGLDILAVMAICATVAVGDYWAALIVVLMLTGGAALEDYASARAHREVAALLARAPLHAHRVRPDGTVEDVAVDQVQVGDLLLVKPGESVPVDGTLEGETVAFDESSLTGESLPVEHVAGDAVLSGSVSEQEVAMVRATVLARDSQYQQIVALVQAAGDSKAPIVRLADRYAVPFTLVAIALAGVAWAVSGDPVRFAEVLVVATPCPLLIAAPVAFIAGMSRAAKNGAVIKSGGVLEQLARIRTAAFDKTGTMTHGRPRVEDVELLRGLDGPGDGQGVGMGADDVLRYAAAAEQYSSHVLAQSVVDAALARGLLVPTASDVEEVTAGGVTAVVDGRRVAVGKAAFVASVTGRSLEHATVVPGRMTVHVGVDDRPVARLVLADEVRANARATLERLRALGVRHEVMLTGDAEPTARHVADLLGVADVRAGLLPVDKVRAVADLPDRPVMMIGDGVNDAPVLAAADVGVAMGAKGSTAASESADVVVMLDDIGRVALTVAIARRTVRIALQAIGVGIALSVVLMVVAAFGLIPAVIGATLQEVVDLVAILGALRAVRPGRDETPVVDGGGPTRPLLPRQSSVSSSSHAITAGADTNAPARSASVRVESPGDVR